MKDTGTKGRGEGSANVYTLSSLWLFFRMHHWVKGYKVAWNDWVGALLQFILTLINLIFCLAIDVQELDGESNNQVYADLNYESTFFLNFTIPLEYIYTMLVTFGCDTVKSLKVIQEVFWIKLKLTCNQLYRDQLRKLRIWDSEWYRCCSHLLLNLCLQVDRYYYWHHA